MDETRIAELRAAKPLPSLGLILIEPHELDELLAEHDAAMRYRQMLERWLAVEEQIGLKDLILGPNTMLIEETKAALSPKEPAA